MSDAHPWFETLHECLMNVPPVALKAQTLIEQPSLRTDREAVRAATLELIAYNTACAKAMDRLRDLPPIPLTAFVSLEWAL